MSNYTEHYNLKKPAKTESYDVDVANTNNDIIDEKIFGKVDKIAGKSLSSNDFTDGYKQKVDKLIEGTKGDSAYQVALKNGFEGTETQWLSSLKGDKGDTGDVSKEELNKITENKRIKLEGKSEQDETPSPDNIVSIRNVGDNINEFSSDLEIGEIDNTTGLNVSNGNGIRTKDYIKVKPNTTYTIKNSNNYMNVVYFYTTDKTFIKYSYSTDTSYTFTTGPTAKYIRVRSSSTNIQNNLTTKYVLIEGQIVANYNEYGCGSIDYIGQNKNLGYVEYYNKIRAYKNGNLIDNNSYNTYKAIVEGNTQYTISFEGTENSVSNLCYFDKSMNYIKGDPFNTENPRILTTPKNCIYITLAVNHDITNFMIEKGKINTGFIEHQAKTIHFPLSEGQVIHKDDYIMNNKIHQNRKTITLTGNETITLRIASQGNSCVFSIDGIWTNKDLTTRGNIVCTHFKNEPINWANTDECIFGGGQNEGNIMYLKVLKSRLSEITSAACKAFIKEQYENNTPIIVEYQLAEEIVTPLTKEQIEAFYELQKAKYVDKMELTCLNEIEPTITDLDKSLEESILDVEKLLAMLSLNS